MNKKRKKVVVIGGGTGNFVVLSGLKNYNISLTAIVSVADSGGSTGRLRSEFGFLPVGDMRQCLAALAEEDSFIRRVLLYRFDKGRGLKGHNLGNLILTALTDLAGSEARAIEVAANIFRLKGRVVPITDKDIQLKAVYKDNTQVLGEHEIDDPKHKGGKKITKLSCYPCAFINKQAEEEILKADMIVFGPGDLYTSVLPNLVVEGVKPVFKKTTAKLIYIVNLMTRFSQTHGFTAKDHVLELEKYLGRRPDFVLINKAKIPEKIKNLYKKEKGFAVKDNLKKGDLKDVRIIKKDFIAAKIIKKKKGDVLQRSYLRHDAKKLAKVLIRLIEK
jgi:uncharacterized cofD-like protein